MTPEREPDPPTVTPVARPRPQPNFWWSLLACVGLVVVQTVAVLIVWVGVWVVLCVAAGGSLQQNIQDDTNGYQQVAAPRAAGDTPPAAFPQRLAWGMMAGVVAGHLAILLYAFVLVRWVFGRRWPRRVGLRRPGVAQLLIAWLVFLPGLMFSTEGLYALLLRLTGWEWNPSMQTTLAAADAVPVWLAVLAIAVGPGVAEELFCRGFLGHGLVGRRGWVVGVLLTSALFGLLHLDPLYVVVTGVIGAGLHFTLATSRSLWVPVVLHTTNNALGLLTVKLASVLPPEFVAPPPPELIALRYGSGAALLALGGWAVWSCRVTVVPVDGDPDGWRPAYPGVAVPPPGSGFTPQPGRLNLLPVLLAVLPMAGVVYSLLPAR